MGHAAAEELGNPVAEPARDDVAFAHAPGVNWPTQYAVRAR